MAEFEVISGRYLSDGMHGYDEINNDPIKMMGHLENVMKKNHHLLGEFLRQSDEQLITEAGWTHAQPYYTAYIESLWLEGKTDLVRSLIRIGV